jgi:hypothetical protein
VNGGANGGPRPAATLAQFKKRPDVARIAEKYADWARTSEGVLTGLQLAFLAMRRVSGQIPRPAYRRAVRELAVTTTIPSRDFLLMAECYLELLRTALTATGQFPFDAGGTTR